MENVQLILNENGRGVFLIEENNEKLAEMEISVKGSNLTSYHTETFEKGKGRGLGRLLMETMADYARKNNLKVIALCPFVHSQFKRYADKYADIWNQEVS